MYIPSTGLKEGVVFEKYPAQQLAALCIGGRPATASVAHRENLHQPEPWLSGVRAGRRLYPPVDRQKSLSFWHMGCDALRIYPRVLLATVDTASEPCLQPGGNAPDCPAAVESRLFPPRSGGCRRHSVLVQRQRRRPDS